MSNLLPDQNKINYEVILNSTDPVKRRTALDGIDDERIFSDIVINVEDQEIRLEAVKKINNEEQLCKLTELNCGRSAGFIAVDKISDSLLLKRVVKNASNKKVRNYAIDKLNLILTVDPSSSVDKNQEKELRSLLDSALQLSESWNWEYADSTLSEMRPIWEKWDPELKHDLYPEFEKMLKHFSHRYEQFKIRQIEEKMLAAEKELKMQELTKLCEEVEGFTLNPEKAEASRFSELKSQWQQKSEDSGDWIEELDPRFTRACQTFLENQQRLEKDKLRRNEAIEKLKVLSEQAERIAMSESSHGLEKEMALIKKNWKALVFEGSEIDEIRSLYEKAVDSYSIKFEEFKQVQEKEYKDGLDHLGSLCKRVEDQINSTDRIDAQRQVTEIQGEWKDLHSKVSFQGSDKSKFIHEFRELLDRFYERQREFKEHRDWEQWANLMLKEELCRELESNLKENDLFKVAKILKTTKPRWKEVGFVPQEKSDYIWDRYKKICDLLYGKCKVFFDQLDLEHSENLKLKEEICKNIEEIISSDNLTNSFAKFKDLKSKWYSIGHVPRDREEQVIKRFKSLSDQYFEKRKESIKSLRKQQAEALNLKKGLCEKVEALLDADDLHREIRKIKLYNEEWKKIGPIYGKKENDLWTRFRTGCDQFFGKLDEKKPDNLIKKQAINVEIEKILSSLKKMESMDTTHLNECAKQIISIQKSWKEIGRVPAENENETWEKFSKNCDEFFELRRNLAKDNEELYEGIVTSKKKLVAEMEEIVSSEQISETSSRVNKIMSEWQDLGHIPIAVDRKLGLQFRELCDSYFDRKRGNFKGILKEQSQKSKEKESLCLQMESLAGKQSTNGKNSPQSNLSLSEQLQIAFESNFVSASSAAGSNDKFYLQNLLDEAKKIQNNWKRIGFVQGEKNKRLNDRFKKACDVFYAQHTNKKPELSKEEMKSNQASKLKICEKLEGYVRTEDPASHINSVKKCQKSWKRIGQVLSKKDADELWARYTKACDKVFAALRQQEERA